MRTEEIINLVQEKNISVYRTHLRAEQINHGVEFIHFSDFISFAQNEGVRSMFLAEVFDSIDEYYISDDTVNLYSECALKIIEKQVRKYNKRLQGLDFDIPVIIIVACAVEGTVFYTLFENEILLDGEPLTSANDKLKEIIDEHYDEIIEEQEEREKNIQKLKSKLKQDVIFDEEFHRCTNKHLRYSYLSNLYHYKLKGEFAELKQYWKSPGLGIFTKDAEDFIELAWREIKTK